jgi:acylphosphatase
VCICHEHSFFVTLSVAKPSRGAVFAESMNPDVLLVTPFAGAVLGDGSQRTAKLTVCRDPSTAASVRSREPMSSLEDDNVAGMTSTEKAIEARRFVVRGRVQGVGFRWFVEREAHILGIAGWVRNKSDGSVEVLAQASRDQLSGLRSRLREGPRAARVDAVEESEVRTAEGITSFRIEGAW